MSKVITVFGATGNQGGSVVKAILADPTLSKEFKIRAVTRDPSKPNAKALADKGCELVTADMDDEKSLVKILEGADTVFILTDYWAHASAERELQQGKNVTDAAKEAGVKQIIYSSLMNVTKASNGQLTHVKHFDSKADIEDYIRSTGITCAFVQPGYFMSNYKMFLQKADDGNFNLYYPVGEDAVFPLIDIAEDYGKFVVPALKNPAKWNGKKILASVDYYPVSRIVSEFNQAASGGTKINFTQISNEQYEKTLPEFMAREMLENHLLFGGVGYYGGASLKESLDAVDVPLTSWSDFVKKNY